MSVSTAAGWWMTSGGERVHYGHPDMELKKFLEEQMRSGEEAMAGSGEAPDRECASAVRAVAEQVSARLRPCHRQKEDGTRSSTSSGRGPTGMIDLAKTRITSLATGARSQARLQGGSDRRGVAGPPWKRFPPDLRQYTNKYQSGIINHGNTDRFSRAVFFCRRMGTCRAPQTNPRFAWVCRRKNARWQCVVSVDEEGWGGFLPLRLSLRRRRRAVRGLRSS